MRAQNIKAGEWYKHRTNSNYGHLKAIKILKPKEFPNTNKYIVVLMENHGMGKDSFYHQQVGIRPMDLVKDA